MKILVFWSMTPCRFVLGTKVTFQRYIGLHWRYRQWNWNVGNIYKYTRLHIPENWPLCTQDNHSVYQHKFTTSSEQKTELLAHRIRLFRVLEVTSWVI